MKRYSFPKQERLYLREDIKTLFYQRKGFLVYPFRVLFNRKSTLEDGGVAVLINVPKRKIRKAHDRNKIKRRTKEAYRLEKERLLSLKKGKEGTLHVAILYIASEVLAYKVIERAMRKIVTGLSEEMYEYDQENFFVSTENSDTTTDTSDTGVPEVY